MSAISCLLHPHHASLVERPHSLGSLLRTLAEDDPYYDHYAPPYSALTSHASHRHLSAPKFNVVETATAYFLDGELAGVRRKEDVFVEWLANRTLIVRGAVPKHDPVREWGMQGEEEEEEEVKNGDVEVGGAGKAGTAAQNGDAVPTAAPAQPSAPAATIAHPAAAPEQPTTATDTAPAPPPNGSTYGNPQIYDADKSSNFVNKLFGQPTHQHQQSPDSHHGHTKQDPQHQHPHQDKHWLSERRTGDFERSFTFSHQVDAEGMKARLEDGLLMIMVPKLKGVSEVVQKVLVE